MRLSAKLMRIVFLQVFFSCLKVSLAGLVSTGKQIACDEVEAEKERGPRASIRGRRSSAVQQVSVDCSHSSASNKCMIPQ